VTNDECLTTSVPIFEETGPAKTSTARTIVLFVIISAIGLSIVLDSSCFVWYRMKKKREQSEVQLVELSGNR
jgi:hypothetical protein